MYVCFDFFHRKFNGKSIDLDNLSKLTRTDYETMQKKILISLHNVILEYVLRSLCEQENKRNGEKKSIP